MSTSISTSKQRTLMAGSAAERMPSTPNDAPKNVKEILEMLMYEELARARIRDLEEALGGHLNPTQGVRRFGRWQGRKPRRNRASARSS
ncbi:hypothetical protein SAMN05216266_12816 [Amycolatopsis marina]|uniref:Uncharacterized protein n=1 Tax=Amycolatopsis marina TaxID=490629 RepID=A0A1I1CG92_9PSEU|nr:hypothetical protein [Amycolatopsis marina]SFB61487.1 hypothetical protein SAMN05216266_12816 [Amycolatopsis marina]